MCVRRIRLQQSATIPADVVAGILPAMRKFNVLVVRRSNDGVQLRFAIVELSSTNFRGTRYHLPPKPDPAPTRPSFAFLIAPKPVSYTHLRAHETRHDLVC